MDAEALGGVLSFARDRPLVRAAVDFAGRAHAGRRRASDDAPFVVHPLEVAAMLAASGAGDAVVAAAALHDVVEHEGTAIDAIAAGFGADVAALVAALTEDPSIEPRSARKAALRNQVAVAGADAGTIFAADQLARARELRASRGADDPAGRAGQLAQYAASLAALERLIPADPLVALLCFELEALADIPSPAAPEALYA
jgi:guanosine-3',5'-bis(diphosphate) 3'-pyrophosphohydrolase